MRPPSGMTPGWVRSPFQNSTRRSTVIATRPNASVKDALLHSVDTLLRPRRTRAAAEERAKLELLLTPVRLRHGDDVRVCAFQKADGCLDTSSLYKALMAAHTPHTTCSDFIWKNRAPPRVQFFVWLLVQRRVHSRSNLLKKSIVTDATCELCRNHPEPVDHLAFACPVAASLWQHVGVDLPLTVDTLHSMATQHHPCKTQLHVHLPVLLEHLETQEPGGVRRRRSLAPASPELMPRRC